MTLTSACGKQVSLSEAFNAAYDHIYMYMYNTRNTRIIFKMQVSFMLLISRQVNGPCMHVILYAFLCHNCNHVRTYSVITVRELLELRDERGKTALIVAARAGQVRILLQPISYNNNSNNNNDDDDSKNNNKSS
jgi:hypothetical protein